MFDLSPEKIMALLAVGLVVLGPNRLPATARSLAQGLARARRLAETLTQPVQASLAEPRQTVDNVLADVRDAVHAPARSFEPQAPGQRPAPAVAPSLSAEAEPAAEVAGRFDPGTN